MDAIGVIVGRGQAKGKPEFVILSLFQLAQMLKAGVGIGDALDDMREMETGRALHRVWSSLAKGVKSGRAMSEVMLEWPSVFDATSVALIRAGEKHGDLATACISVHDYLDWHRRLKSRLTTLLVYPLFSFIVFLLVAGFLLLSVVPAIEGYLLSSGTVIAWHTSLLIAVSEWLRSSWAMVTGTLVSLLVVFVIAMRVCKRWRLLVDAQIIRLPLVGPLVVSLSLSRYAHCTASLYGSGITLEESLQLSEETVGNRYLRRQLSSVRLAMMQGHGFGESLKKFSHIPIFFKRMVCIGESTGTLEYALKQMGDQQQQNSEITIERVEQLIAPIMLTGIGSCLLWVVASMLTPVYSAAINTVLQL